MFMSCVVLQDESLCGLNEFGGDVAFAGLFALLDE